MLPSDFLTIDQIDLKCDTLTTHSSDDRCVARRRNETDWSAVRRSMHRYERASVLGDRAARWRSAARLLPPAAGLLPIATLAGLYLPM